MLQFDWVTIEFQSLHKFFLNIHMLLLIVILRYYTIYSIIILYYIQLFVFVLIVAMYKLYISR